MPTLRRRWPLYSGSGVYEGVTLALEYLTLTAARSGEVRGATWDEIDMAAATWTVSAERMKAGVEHRVPLSARAVDVLRRARELSGPDPDSLIFPSVTGRQLADDTLSKPLRQAAGATVHGLRSSFRDWCAETGQSREAAEAALSHVSAKNSVEAAYFRSDVYALRIGLMQDWSDYLSR